MINNIIENIINEELDRFLNEIEYQDNDIIDKSKIDLSAEYSKLNQQLFNNQLPKVQMRWSTRKSNLGHVSAYINRKTNENKINHLAISGFYAMPYMVFKNTLAHEMIHIKLLSTNEHNIRDPHDYNFFREANRINGMGLGYKITKSSEEQLGVSDTVKNNKILIAIILEIDNKKFLSVTTPIVFQRDSHNIYRIFNNLVSRGKYRSVKITAVESKNGELLKYRTGKSYANGVAYAPLSDELLNQLLQDTVIDRREFQLGGEQGISETENDAGNWEEIIIV